MKKNTVKVNENELQFEDILQATPSEQEPPRELEGTIPNGKRDEIIEKIISEANEV